MPDDTTRPNPQQEKEEQGKEDKPHLEEPTPASLDALWQSAPPLPEAALRHRIATEREAMATYVAAKHLKGK